MNNKYSPICNSKKFYKFLQQDTWESLIAFFVIAIILIKFVFFPLLSMLTGTVLPLVIVESCSMYHSNNGMEEVVQKSFYKQNGITIDDTSEWDFKNGLNKGDVIFVMGDKTMEEGDVIIFNGGTSHPIIHRLIDNDEPYATYGDHNPGQLATEKQIGSDQLVGKAIFKIPYIGWIKLIFFEGSRSPDQRGLCK